MIVKLIFPILAGISIVFQGTLNRHVASQVGLLSAVFLNALVFLILASILWCAVRYQLIPSADFFSAKPFQNLHWLDILPGILGFAIVFSTPIAIRYFGANLAFSTIVCTQIIGSLILDAIGSKQVPDLKSIAGTAIILFGVFLLYLSRK